jgi:hypothetical protein
MRRFRQENLLFEITRIICRPQVAAQLPSDLNDGKWYRAIIREMTRKEGTASEMIIEVFYLDYGDTGYLSFCDIRPLDERFDVLPPFAVECFIPDIMPAGWSIGLSKAFSKNLLSKEIILN